MREWAVPRQLTPPQREIQSFRSREGAEGGRKQKGKTGLN